MVTLTWRTLPGNTRVLNAGPGLLNEIGGCYYIGPFGRAGARIYRAWAHVGGVELAHQRGSYSAAMRALEHDLDRRSIGLFGVDDLTFATQ